MITVRMTGNTMIGMTCVTKSNMPLAANPALSISCEKYTDHVAMGVNDTSGMHSATTSMPTLSAGMRFLRPMVLP